MTIKVWSLAAFALAGLGIPSCAKNLDREEAIGEQSSSTSLQTPNPGGNPGSLEGVGGSTPSASKHLLEVTIASDNRVSLTLNGENSESSTIELGQGDQLEVAIQSGVEDQFHLHGYDIFKDLQPGQKTTFNITLETPGEFEAELHHTEAQLFKLQVG
jgi:hypothetical protein